MFIASRSGASYRSGHAGGPGALPGRSRCPSRAAEKTSLTEERQTEYMFECRAKFSLMELTFASIMVVEASRSCGFGCNRARLSGCQWPSPTLRIQGINYN